jgi:hypothetical protein
VKNKKYLAEEYGIPASTTLSINLKQEDLIRQ